MTLQKHELIRISGGASFSATLVNAVIKGFQSLFNLGKSLGTSLYQVIHGRYC